VPRAESRAVVVDACFAGWHACQFLFDHLGGISYRSVDSPPLFSRHDLAPDIEFPGQLYLGVFSGPVEGILMIVTIFMITGFYGARPKRPAEITIGH
jgi:hypothetical protein